MKTILTLTTVLCCLLTGCDKGRFTSRPKPADPQVPGEPMPVPGDRTRDHWAPPSSGKPEGALPDPLTGTPNQDPNLNPDANPKL